MENLRNQPPNDQVHELSFDPPDDETTEAGGKSTGSAPAREISFDPPDDETIGSGGKSTGSAAPAREH